MARELELPFNIANGESEQTFCCRSSKPFFLSVTYNNVSLKVCSVCYVNLTIHLFIYLFLAGGGGLNVFNPIMTLFRFLKSINDLKFLMLK